MQTKMTREDAEKILKLPKADVIAKIVELGNKAEKYDKLARKSGPSKSSDDDPATPSGMKPPYEKPPGKKRKKRPGQKKGHPGAARPKPDKIDHRKEHTLSSCPECKNELGKPVASRKCYTEDIPSVETEVTQHTIHGYWCSCCKKIVYPKVSDALPNAMKGARTQAILMTVFKSAVLQKLNLIEAVLALAKKVISSDASVKIGLKKVN